MSINKYHLVCSISLWQYKWTKSVILYWCFWEIDIWVGLCKCRELTKEQITGYRACQPGLLDGREGGSPQNRDGSEGRRRVWRKLDGEGYRKAGISTPKTDWQHGRMAERLALTQLKYTRSKDSDFLVRELTHVVYIPDGEKAEGDTESLCAVVGGASGLGQQ